MQTTKIKTISHSPENENHHKKTINFPLHRKAEYQVVLQGIIENLIDGILIVSEQKELIYANDIASRVLRQLNHNRLCADLVPREIWHICQSLIQSRNLFPNQSWTINSEIFTNDSTVLHIQAKWLTAEIIDNPCILLTVKDQYQTIKNRAVEEAEKYGLTPREKEVWLLQRARYTYKEIAEELSITPNTVKKHMRGIHAKQKEICELDE
ncbi:LuxR C-terminal-related transcriptional regulator [Lyngbya aestuarii]|uniref:LuxR C-terminal-related transcriptional regulator n=1 Tax=Lyngbya aestuarii TaxID=118322 RepID=UPI00403D8FEC